MRTNSIDCLRPLAEEEPVVVRLTEQAIGKVANRFGGRVDEQTDRLLLRPACVNTSDHFLAFSG